MQTALVIILLLAILAGAVFVGHYGWVSAGNVAMPTWGWLMMGLGISLPFWLAAVLWPWCSTVAVPASMSRRRLCEKRSIEQPSGPR